MPPCVATLLGRATCPAGTVKPRGSELPADKAPVLLMVAYSMCGPATVYTRLLAGSKAEISAPFGLACVLSLVRKSHCALGRHCACRFRNARARQALPRSCSARRLPLAAAAGV